MNARNVIAFPRIAASLGGASRVEFNEQLAWIFVPELSEPFQMQRIYLPPDPTTWSAFTLADKVKEMRARK